MATESSSSLPESQVEDVSLSIPADLFRRTIEQEDRHTRACRANEIRSKFSRFRLPTDEIPDFSNKLLWPTLVNDASAAAVSRFLDRNIHSSYWSSDLRTPSGRYSTNLRCITHKIKPGVYNVCWHFAYIISRHEWTDKSKPATLICFAGKAVNGKSFMNRTTDPTEPWISQDWNDIIKPQNRTSNVHHINTRGLNLAQGISEGGKELAGYLALMSRDSLTISGDSNQEVAVIVRKLGAGQGNGELFFLGCESFLAVNSAITPSSPSFGTLPTVPAGSEHEWPHQPTYNHCPAIQPSFATLCKIYRGIFIGSIPGKVSSVSDYTTLLRDGKKNMVVLDQTTEELMLAARRNCHFCFVRWRTLKLHQEDRGDAAGSPILYYLVGLEAVDRLVTYHIPTNGTRYLVTEFQLLQASKQT